MLDMGQAERTLRSTPKGVDDGVFTRHRARVNECVTGMENDMKKQATRKICFNRGNLRLWIEGKFLIECGFNHGDRYDLIDLQSGRYVLLKTENGARKIAGNAERPIVDINSTKTLEKLGKAGDMLTLVSKEAGRITVERIEE